MRSARFANAFYTIWEGGWPPAQNGNAHGVEEIVYDGNEIAFFQKKKKKTQ